MVLEIKLYVMLIPIANICSRTILVRIQQNKKLLMLIQPVQMSPVLELAPVK
jgi:hypothetical protein